MINTSIYQDIAVRAGGDIYIGVVGPVVAENQRLSKGLWMFWYFRTWLTLMKRQE